MKDFSGDVITLGTTSPAGRGDPGIWITFEYHDSGESVTMLLSPKKARKFIRKLQQATARVEINQRDSAR